jgi:hypothetical protein
MSATHTSAMAHDAPVHLVYSHPAGAIPALGGMDVAVFANGKIRTLDTFIETAVAAEVDQP